MKELNFLVIALSADTVQAARFILTQGSNRLDLVRQLTEQYQRMDAELAKLVKKIGLPHDARIIITLDHRHASTWRSVMATARADAKIPVTEIELENVISRSLWKFFNKVRHTSALKMNVQDVEVKVAGADALGIQLDAHRVTDAIGFCARDISIECQQTLVPQGLLHGLLEVVPQEQVVHITESGAAWALLALQGSKDDKNKIEKDKDKEFLFLNVGERETVIYACTEGSLQYLDVLGWGSRDIVSAIERLFGVAGPQAQEVIELYQQGKTSESVVKSVEAALSQELAILLKGIEAQRKEGESRRIFISSEFALPEALLSDRLRRKLDMRFLPTIVSGDWISEKSGYTLKLMNDAPRCDTLYVALAGYLVGRSDSVISKIAKRRARWM